MNDYKQGTIDELFEQQQDPCEGCTTRSCEWGICSYSND
jgi:hypothetical protein